MGNELSRKPLNPLKELPYETFIPLGKKIAVYVVATPGIYEYTKYTIPLIEEWAKIHGYSFFKVETNLLPDLEINFTKIQVALDLFSKGYEYVMHVDADAPIINLNYPIENIIKTYMKGSVTALFSEDCFNKNDCSQPGKQNTGIFIVKNTRNGNAFLEYWKESARTGPCKQYATQFPNCQLVLWNCVIPKYHNYIKTLPYNVLNGRDGLLVNHLMQSSGVERNRIAKELHFKLLQNKRTGIYN